MNDASLELYEQMYLVRRAEIAIRKHYFDDQMKTPMHMSMGEEAIVAGVCKALGPDAQMLGTYRSHAMYLIKTGDLDGFFAEMYGKATGIVGGRGGSMHLLSPERGVIGTSAIVASCIPVAAGAAFANKCKGTNRVVAVFFGDGAIDEGVFWETMNVACKMSLPVLFVCEDNDLAVHVRAEHRHGYRDIAQIITKFDCHVAASKSTDPRDIYKLTQDVLAKMKATGQPGFLHLSYFRFLEHVGVNEDFNAGYRAAPDANTLAQLDPVPTFRAKILAANPAAPIDAIEARINQRVDDALRAAQNAPFPTLNNLTENLYA